MHGMKLKLLKVFSEKNMFEWAKNDNEIFEKIWCIIWTVGEKLVAFMH